LRLRFIYQIQYVPFVHVKKKDQYLIYLRKTKIKIMKKAICKLVKKITFGRYCLGYCYKK
jgi:hypothetical protein